MKSNKDLAIGVSLAFYSRSFVVMRSLSRSSRASAEESGFLVTTPSALASTPYAAPKVMSSFFADKEAPGLRVGFIYLTMGFEKRSLLTNTNFYLLRSDCLLTDSSSAGLLGVLCALIGDGSAGLINLKAEALFCRLRSSNEPTS